MIWTLIILALLLLLNAVLAASELAMMTSRPARLQAMSRRGHAGARHAIALAKEPTRFLSTVQVGITLVAILQGAYGERALVGGVEEAIAGLPLVGKHAGTVAMALVVGGLTYAMLVFGELIPKRIALAHPEAVATLIAPPLAFISWIAAWPVWVLTASTDRLLSLVGIRQRSDEVSEEDVRAMVARATSTGIVDPIEHRIFERALRVGDMTTKSLMVPRGQITWIDSSMPAEDVQVLIGTAPFSHFPVCSGSIDRLEGVVHVKDLISYGLLAGKDFRVGTVMQPPLYVPDTMPALKLLQLFQANRTRIAFVVDEHGGLEGLVTANDVVQALLGDMSRSGEDEQPGAVQRDDGSWLLDGRLPLPEVTAALGIEGDSLEELPDVATAAGLVTALLGDLPTPGAHASWCGWRFEVVELDGRRVDKVLVSRDLPQGPSSR
jgi:putative hemolysin